MAEKDAPKVWGKISPDGRLAISVDYSYFYLRDAADGTILHAFDRENSSPWKADFTPDGKLFLWYGSVREEKTVDGKRVTDNKTMAEFWEIIPGKTPVLRQSIDTGPGYTEGFPTNEHFYDFSSDGKILLTASLRDGGSCSGICMWDIETGDLLHELLVSGPMYLSNNGQYVLNIDWMRLGPINIWDISSEQTPIVYQELTQFISSYSHEGGQRMFFTPDGKTLTTLTDNYLFTWDTRIQLWDVSASPSTQTPPPLDLDDEVHVFAASPDGLWWATTGRDGNIDLRTPENGLISKTLTRPTDTLFNDPGPDHIVRICFSASGSWLAAASSKAVWMWDRDTGEFIRRIQADENQSIYEILFSPDGQILVASGFPWGFIDVWETATGKQLRQFDGIEGKIALAPDGFTFAVGESTGRITLFDLRTGNTLCKMQAEGRIEDITFSPDGSLLAVATGQSLEFWDAASAERLKVIPGNAVLLLFSPDSRLLITRDQQSFLSVWGLPETK